MDSQPTDRPQAEAKKKSFLDRFRRSPEPALDVPAFDAPSIDAPISDVPAPAVTGKESQKPSFTQRMRNALSRTGEGIGSLFLGGKTIDEGLLEELETLLLMADVGIEATSKILAQLTERLNRKELKDSTALQSALHEILLARLQPCEQPMSLETVTAPYVILVIGVNGVGKTTTIGKLASQFKKQGLKVVLGAADTFRAAAIDQLQVWAQRTGVPVVSQEMGSDPASVAFDTLKSAVNQEADVVIIDTAGRLHNKVNLMNELTKIKRVMQKVVANAPHDVLLVLDGSTGQNAFEQAKQFTAATEVTALAVTKLDGTAKGGVVIGISDQFKIPVNYIGVGEGIEDLQVFNKLEFVDSFFK